MVHGTDGTLGFHVVLPLDFSLFASHAVRRDSWLWHGKIFREELDSAGWSMVLGTPGLWV